MYITECLQQMKTYAVELIHWMNINLEKSNRFSSLIQLSFKTMFTGISMIITITIWNKHNKIKLQCLYIVENKPSKPKHAKRSRKVASKTKVEVVDDTTVDDLLNNPSSLLSSLDDVLDSLESFTDGKNEKIKEK